MTMATRSYACDAAPSCGSESVSAQLSAEAIPVETPEKPKSQLGLRTMWMMLGGVTAPIIAIDQVSKFYVSSHMPLYGNITLIPNLLDITYALNPGAAFSMFANMPEQFRALVLPILSMVAIVAIMILLARIPRPTITSVALALVLAGAAGNLIDRMIRGRVIDFVRAHYYAYNWPIFNVADSAISIGVALIFLSSILSSRQSE